MRSSVAVALVLLAPLAAPAFDPDTRWRTLVSANFHVHYPEGYYAHALNVARRAEAALDVLGARLGWRLDEPVHVVVNDETDSANGLAQSVPYSRMVLNVVAPGELSELGSYRDWTTLLVTHELCHILHMDTTLGLPAVLNDVFGKWFAPNAVQPDWFVEGLATYFESALTGSGRVNSPYFDMYLRAAVLEDALPTLGVVSGSTWRWPQGSIPYLYGGYFVHYLAKRFGVEALKNMSHDYGGRLMPFSVNATAENVIGQRYPELYADFLQRLRARFHEQARHVRERGLLQGTPLTRRGQRIGTPRVSADNVLYYVEAPIGDRPRLMAQTPAGDERVVAEVEGEAHLALPRQGRVGWVSQMEVSETYRVYHDLYTVDLDSGRIRRRTQGARAQDPDVTGGGDMLAFIQVQGERSVLRIAPTADLAAARTLVDLGVGAYLWRPRFSPEGNAVAFSAHVDGSKDIFVVDLATQRVRALTQDEAADGSPVFTPDGRWVLFHSDRDGIFNIYAAPRDGGALRRVTRVLTGAFEPEIGPAGDDIVYTSYSARGFDLARMPLRPAEWQEEPEAVPAPRAHAELSNNWAVYPAVDYSAWHTVWPRAWLPLLSADARGETLGASVGGEDAVGRHRYLLQGWWGLESRFAGFNAYYDNAQFHPGVGLELTRRLSFAPVPLVQDTGRASVLEEVWRARDGTYWPLWTRRRARLSLLTAYDVSWHRSNLGQLMDPDEATLFAPDMGRFSALTLGLSVATTQMYPDSISPEAGGRLDVLVRAEDRLLGSEHRSRTAVVAADYYLENPLLSRHVLAFAAFGGYGTSSYARRRLFAIGGLPRTDILLDVLGGRFATPRALRGFPLLPFVGDAIVEGHVEYRLPVWDFETGIDTLPVFFRSLHAAAFVDGAAVADELPALKRPAHQHYSAGGEARMDLLLGYAIPVTLRLGYGEGLGRDRVRGMYVVLGQVL